MIRDSEVRQAFLQSEPKEPLFSLILHPADLFVLAFFWGDGEGRDELLLST